MITFAEAKNGDKICIKDSFPLHSSYNPQKEAERFVSTLEVQFEPSWIIITEPALSYAAQFLRLRFTNAKLCAIRFCKDFSDFDKLWDKVFYFEDGNLKDQLFNFFGEESAGSLFFASWKPSENAFKDVYISVWENIKAYITLSRDVLGTRIYFNKRWNKNAVKFALYLNRAINYDRKIDKPIVIAASGPSLENIIPHLKTNRKRFFLLAVSSAAKPLIEHEVLPDAVISTDGGWYAQEHLKQLNFNDIPLFLSSESYLSSKMLQSCAIIPLSYKDGIEALLLEKAGIKALKAERNGTVSGTAAELALQLSDSDIFFCGLDLCSSSGFQHTQPNELELDKAATDTRLNQLETRAALGSFENASLEIYRNWFSARPSSFAKRIKRVYFSGSPIKYKLEKIEDIDEKAFKNLIQRYAENDDCIIDSAELQKLDPCSLRAQKLCNYFAELHKAFEDYYNSENLIESSPFELELWFKSLCLGDFLAATQRHEKMSETMYNKLQDSLLELEGIIRRYDRQQV